MSGLVTYPAGLPAPTAMNLTPAERRAAEGLAVESTAAASARALQRDFAGTAALTFVFSAAQYAQWLAWWKDDLVYGGAWFSAPTWPFPWGLGGVLRHASAPTVRHLGRGIREVSVQADVRGASLPPQLRTSFDALLAMLMRNLQPQAETPQTPRWLPDADGDDWYVRPISAMATNEATADRYLSGVEDSLHPGQGGFVNHPLSGARTVDPIDPDSVVALGYANTSWSGTPVVMETTVEAVVEGGNTVYYIHAHGGPVGGTVRLTWRYADLATLDGSSYALAWPSLPAVLWGMGGVQASDTLWVCGTHRGAGLTVGASGTAGNYIKIRLDHPTDPGRIDKAAPITTAWTAEGSEWWTPLEDVSECMFYEDEQRLVGCNIRSRCRTPISAVDTANDTITFTNIRRVNTGDVIDIASDFVSDKLPGGLAQNTRYYAIVVSSPWISSPSTTFYGVVAHTYVVKLAASYADAIAGTAIDLGARGSEPPPNAFVFVRQTTYPFYDPVPGALQPGQYAMDVVQQRLYYRPSSGNPDAHDVRVAAETYGGDASFGAVGSCIYGINRSYIKILGGGEYGGLFADTAAPAGRIGLSNSNAVEFDSGEHIVVDGLLIDGCRSGVTFKNIEYGTVRNNRIRNAAHHACGGEDLTGTQEPYLMLERNWITEIGDKHEFGDAQALVTNPDCHDAIYRRNYVQGVGRNTKVSNPSGAVFDASANVHCYLNWFDYCYGKAFELGAGNGEPLTDEPVIAANIVTRQGQGDDVDRADNLIQRTGVVHVVLNGPTDPGVAGAQVFGNLIAYTTIGVRAPDTLDDCGAVYQRTNNNSGSGVNEISVFRQNAFLDVVGPVFSAQKNSNAASAPWPTLVSDYNLYANCSEFAITASSGTILDTWSVDEVFGGAGTWVGDTGRDANSVVTQLLPGERSAEPTLQDLEILRLHDAYDTAAAPTLAMVGNFPFDEAVA